MSRGKITSAAIGAVAAALLVAGLTVFLTGPGPVSFGWFGYAPLSGSAPDGTFDGIAVWSHREEVGALMVVIGLIVTAAFAGYLFGSRHRTSRR